MAIFMLSILVYIILLGLLSCWLNKLYQTDKEQLAYPHKYPAIWQLRWLKILSITGGLLLLATLKDMDLAAYLVCAGSPKGFFLAIFASFLLIMLTSDLEQQIIYDKQLCLFAVFGMIQTLLLYPTLLADHLIAAIAGGAGFLLLAILTRGGIGGGDIKLIAALGLWLGTDPLEVVALGGIVLGGIFALFAMLLRGKKRKDFIPYSPAFILLSLLMFIIF